MYKGPLIHSLHCSEFVELTLNNYICSCALLFDNVQLDAQIVVQQTEIGLRIVDERARTDHHRADVRYR